MTTKEEYFAELSDWETEELFLTNRTDLVNEECKHNCIWVSISFDIAKQTTTTDFISFMNRVKANRKQQIQQSSVDINLIYYIWFDDQAGQLRFNFINSNHDKLPFRCKLIFVDSEKEIIDDFLNSNYLEGIPWNELKVIDKVDWENIAAEEEENLKTFTLKVYRQMIYRDE